jgi:hypothetical protein
MPKKAVASKTDFIRHVRAVLGSESLVDRLSIGPEVRLDIPGAKPIELGQFLATGAELLGSTYLMRDKRVEYGRDSDLSQFMVLVARVADLLTENQPEQALYGSDFVCFFFITGH